jgi:hypothetical protein
MSRRHLTLVLAAVASLIVSACSASPTAPSAKAPIVSSGINGDGIIAPPTDSTGISGRH